jgi:hypothetical protein
MPGVSLRESRESWAALPWPGRTSVVDDAAIGERAWDHERPGLAPTEARAMTTLRWAYLGLAGGLMLYGAILLWLGLRRPSRPGGLRFRLVMAAALLVAVAGTTAAVILEAQASRPW